MITYLLGAGASKNAIPIVGELTSSMVDIKLQMVDEFAMMSDYIEINGEPYSTKSLLEALLEDFEWLNQSALKHQSIDTFAKKLYIQREFLCLKKLKIILSIYFIIIQAKKSSDMRYDSFFASLLSEDHFNFPPNLRILTWNYDYQLEKAYAEFSKDFRFDSCHSLLNVFAKNCRYQNFKDDRFGVVKLNGTASLAFDHNNSRAWNIFENPNMTYDMDLKKILLRHYGALLHRQKTKDILVPTLSFAWEDYSPESGVIKKAIDSTFGTEILVVIGYSFPFFNRFADRAIIRQMAGLKKVYFQAPDAEILRERFLAIRDDIKNENLILRHDVNQFVFPNEF
jgi:hypothetical protein